jgi:hypothetical protein
LKHQKLPHRTRVSERNILPFWCFNITLRARTKLANAITVLFLNANKNCSYYAHTFLGQISVLENISQAREIFHFKNDSFSPIVRPLCYLKVRGAKFLVLLAVKTVQWVRTFCGMDERAALMKTFL